MHAKNEPILPIPYDKKEAPGPGFSAGGYILVIF